MARTILITGVSIGHGSAIAREALSRGDTVVGTVRKQDDLDEFESLAPGRSVGRFLDLSDTDAMSPLVEEVEAAVGPVDVLINNAGYGLAGVIEELAIDDLRRQLDVGVIGQIGMVQAVLPGMRARRRGMIVSVSSMGGVITFPANGAYHGAKFAILGMADALSKEVASFGIRVMSVLPGLYNTGWSGRSRAQTNRRIDDYEELHAQLEAPSMSGDPARLAAVVLDAVDADEPPLRLLVGHSAVELVRAELARQSDETDRWAEKSDTDGDG